MGCISLAPFFVIVRRSTASLTFSIMEGIGEGREEWGVQKIFLDF